MFCCALGALIAAGAALWARAKGLALLAAGLLACAALATAMLAHHAARPQTAENARFEAFLMSALCRGSGPATWENGRCGNGCALLSRSGAKTAGARQAIAERL